MRNREYVKPLRCEHRDGYQAGYCDPCWRAALDRGLSSDEWAALHRGAANQPRRTRTKGLPSLKGLTPAKPWNGTVAADISTAIAAGTEDTIRDRCARWIGAGAHGFTVRQTDGYRLFAQRGTGPELAGLTTMLDAYPYVWADLPAGVDVAVRRVLLIHDHPKRPKIVTPTLAGPDLIVSAPLDGDTASERIGLASLYPEVSISLNAVWLLEVLRGPLQLGIVQTERAMLRPASDDWRYVQMGYRA